MGMQEGTSQDACESHIECVLSCAKDGSCCGSACGCDIAYNKTYSAKLDAHRDAQCDGATFECPQAECPPHVENVPRCVEGTCTAVARPDTETRKQPGSPD
jgi:hypothetical protein